MGKALYRKYRSRSLGEIVGQEHITETLGRAIKAGRISHAYLFTGPRGTGKTSVARILAHDINGLPYSDNPNLDIIEIDAASNRRIDDIRDLREKVHIAPVGAKYKVYIIDEVHMLTGESFNALLKTLEEPPSHAVFILATTESHKLPATIISRTQRFSFKPGTQKQVVTHLRTIADKEHIRIDDEALELIAQHSEGGFRDSLSLLDQISHMSSSKVTAQDVATMLGLAPRQEITNIVAAYHKKDREALIASLANLDKQGTNPSAIVDQLVKTLLAESADLASLQLIDRLLDVPRAYNPHVKLIATLAGFQSAPKKEAPKSAPALAAPAPVTIAEVATTVKTPVAPKKTESSNPVSPATTQHLDALSTDDWSRIMAHIKQKSPPIFAALKHGQPVTDDGKVILKIKNSFMAKKVDGPTQRALIAECLQLVLGASPAIEIVVDKNATPPVITDDPQITSVATIMGGGELINAPAPL